MCACYVVLTVKRYVQPCDAKIRFWATRTDPSFRLQHLATYFGARSGPKLGCQIWTLFQMLLESPKRMPAILVPIFGCQICQLWTDFWSIYGFQIWDHFWPQKWNLEFSPLLKIYFDPENGSVFGSKNRSIFGPKNWNPKFNMFGSTSGPKMGRLSWNPKKKQKFQPKAEPWNEFFWGTETGPWRWRQNNCKLRRSSKKSISKARRSWRTLEENAHLLGLSFQGNLKAPREQEEVARNSILRYTLRLS